MSDKKDNKRPFRNSNCQKKKVLFVVVGCRNLNKTKKV